MSTVRNVVLFTPDERQVRVLRDAVLEHEAAQGRYAAKFRDTARRLRDGESIPPWSDGDDGAHNAERYAAERAADRDACSELLVWIASSNTITITFPVTDDIEETA